MTVNHTNIKIKFIKVKQENIRKKRKNIYYRHLKEIEITQS